jgi:uncharacterized integral membrane protein
VFPCYVQDGDLGARVGAAIPILGEKRYLRTWRDPKQVSPAYDLMTLSLGCSMFNIHLYIIEFKFNMVYV